MTKREYTPAEKRMINREVSKAVKGMREDFDAKIEAFMVADQSVWATSILMACGYAMKEMLVMDSKGRWGAIASATNEIGWSDEDADELVQTMIKRAVEVLVVIDQHGLSTEEEIDAYLRDNDLPEQQPQN